MAEDQRVVAAANRFLRSRTIRSLQADDGTADLNAFLRGGPATKTDREQAEHMESERAEAERVRQIERIELDIARSDAAAEHARRAVLGPDAA